MHRSVMAVVAGRSIGEFRHLQRAQPNRAGILQTLQCGRGCGRNEIAADFRAAGDHLAGVVIHVLVRQRHAMQRAADLAFRKRRIGDVGCRQRGVGFDRHEGIEAGLPLLDAVEAGLRHLARRESLLRDRLRDRGQRQQCRFRAHFEVFSVWTTAKVAGSRSNGSVPAIARKTFERRANRIGDARGDLGAHGHARDVGHRLDLLGCRSRHAASAPFAGARLWPEPGMAI